MRRLLELILLAALAGAALPAPARARQSAAPARIGEVVFSTVAQWESGLRDGLLISNNDDGELRLAEQRTEGVFTSGLEQAGFSFNAICAVWRAELPPGTRLAIEVRSGPAADQLGPWQALAAGDARSQADDGALALESPRMIPTGARFVQLRASFSTTAANASPLLSEISLRFMAVPAGPAQASSLPRVPAPFGPDTLTPPPAIVARESWGAPAPVARVARQQPRGIVLHQIADDGADAPLLLRALSAYDTQVLGWDDLPFHFVVAPDGMIFEGRSGGPTAVVPRLAGGDVAVHVALLGGGAPPAPQRSALVSLLAWLGQAYAIAPLGRHSVAAGAAAPAERPNIVTHGEIAPESADAPAELRSLLDALRSDADAATVRARWYFAEGNVLHYAERLAVANPGAAPASVRFRLLRQPGPEVVREASIPAGGRADLVANTIFSDTTDVPAIVESNAPVIAERFMDFGADISSDVGVARPSRVWYFAEGSTAGDSKTFLLLFNPQRAEVAATLTFVQSDGITTTRQMRIPPQRRSVVVVGDLLPGAEFGMRVIATQPIVAERTMIFGPGSTLNSGGLHTAQGVVTLSRRWYFAEGTTQAPFQMRVLVLNPNAQPAVVKVTFLTPDGTSLARNYAIPPTTRLAINVNEVVPDTGIATTLEADRPVAAERAMYWKGGAAGTAAPGASAPAFTWRFADGRTSGDFQEYLLLSNPNANQSRVVAEFTLADGQRATQAVVMPGNSRYTMAVHQLYPGQQFLTATVRSTQPIVAERSLYVGDPTTAGSRGGATSLGVPEALP